jgi:hypothetical protein
MWSTGHFGTKVWEEKDLTQVDLRLRIIHLLHKRKQSNHLQRNETTKLNSNCMKRPSQNHDSIKSNRKKDSGCF